jgi:hypothetical protein
MSEEKEDFMVFDPCFGWVPFEDLLMPGDGEGNTGTVHEEIPLRN